MTMVVSSRSVLRPRALPGTANRCRWSSVSRMRFLPWTCMRVMISVF